MDDPHITLSGDSCERKPTLVGHRQTVFDRDAHAVRPWVVGDGVD
ncbi:MAG: hypothetical protein K0R99_4905 [Microbacterium sp.]|nr:hypothetical protein [Microbacterium sp.]